MSRIDLGQRYEYLRELGCGGMGRVLLVRDKYLSKELALKLLHELPSDPGELEQFQREFALLSRLEHPGIARAYDFGYIGPRPYFTSEFIPGAPLGARGGLEDIPKILASLRELAEAVAFLHRGGILHLDIKPSNVLLMTQANAAPRPVLIDFGIFRRGLAPPEKALKGSLPYMAPEYFRGEAPGPWTDVYALGVTLYRVITGSLPRSDHLLDGNLSIPQREWEPAPIPPSQLRPSVPKDLDHVILKCLALEPRSRFASAGELFEALERLEGLGPSRKKAARPGSSTFGREAEIAKVDEFRRVPRHRVSSESRMPEDLVDRDRPAAVIFPLRVIFPIRREKMRTFRSGR